MALAACRYGAMVRRRHGIVLPMATVSAEMKGAAAMALLLHRSAGRRTKSAWVLRAPGVAGVSGRFRTAGFR